MNKPLIGITMGDVTGIGPEIIAKSVGSLEVQELCRVVVIGDIKRLRQAMNIVNVKMNIQEVSSLDNVEFTSNSVCCMQVGNIAPDIEFGMISEEAGKHAYLYLEKAVELAVDKKIDAICTAPLNKEAMQKAGYAFPGHTEILAELTGTTDYSMMLSAPNLKVIHLTTHVGLMEAVRSITPERTHNVIKLAHATLSRAGFDNPRIAVCGINPHAGESGLFGCGEEEDKLIPSIDKLVKEGINVEGPYPADTLFYRAQRGDFDIVVACYHDQGHIPIKVLGLEAGVNITVGLKGGVIRTSVDHGTAFDIAGKNIADPGSMIEALKAAIELTPNIK